MDASDEPGSGAGSSRKVGKPVAGSSIKVGKPAAVSPRKAVKPAAVSPRKVVITEKKDSSESDFSDETDDSKTDTSDDSDDPDAGYTLNMIRKLREGAVVSDAEETVDVEDRMKKILQRLKEEYKFNMPDYNISKDKKFKKIVDPNDLAKRLYDDLCKAPVDEDLKSIEMEFYGNGESLTRSILLRSCYFDMFEIILDSLMIPTGKHWHLILGSPGIGKSWFHVFCLHVFIKAEIPVFIQRKGNSALFFKGDVYECKKLKKNILLTRSNIWWLYDRNEDPHEIMSPNSICVLVSSPKRESYKEYAKLCRFGRMYMPQWNYQELKRANRLCTPATSRLTKADLKKRFKLCGGIARHIFDDYDDYVDEYVQDVDDISIEQFRTSQLKNIDKRGTNLPNFY